MLRARYVAFVVTGIVSACAVYDESLLGGDKGSAGSSSAGSPANGGTSEGGSASPAGSNAVGGVGANAGDPGQTPGGADGQAGGDGSGDAGASGEGGTSTSGGTTSGGTGGGGSSNGGGGSGGGGSSSGGNGGGGTGGTGGSSPTGDALVDNMQHATATYANTPFAGVWSRAVTGDMVWTSADVPGMFHKRADSATDRSLRLAAACPSSGTCASDPSTVEVIATLNNGAAVDVSGYTGVSFYVNRVSGTAGILRVAFDDGPSHVGSTSCNGSQPDCGVEPEFFAAANPYVVASGTWTKYQIPFSSFAKNCGWMCTRENALSVKEVYSVRFRIDRNTSNGAVTTIDLDIDDLYFYK